jgi:hypothetical protein
MKRMQDIAASLGIALDAEWRGMESVWPLLDRMRAEGVVVIVKLDGERARGQYTVLATHASKSVFARCDAETLEAATCAVIAQYAEALWLAPTDPELIP